MTLSVVGRNITVTPGMQEAVVDALKRFERYLPKDAEVQVKVRVERDDQICEIVAPYKGAIIRVEQAASSFYEAIDKAADKFAGQMRKYKTRIEKMYRYNVECAADAEEEVPLSDDIIKRKHFNLKPMSVEEAILQMQLIGHAFFVFKNAETGDMNVLYVRKDGKFGLIETDC